MACSELSTAAGTKLYVCAAAPADDLAATWAALTWIEVGNISSISELGRKYAPASFKALGSRTTCKRKGSYDYGSVTVGLGYAAEDVGSVALAAALTSDSDYSFRIAMNDKNATYHTTDTQFYWRGQVMSFVTNPGSDPDSFVTATCEVQIDGDVKIVART